jgi:RHS repeat-associated protein
VQTQYSYEPFGKTTTTGSADSNSFQFTGRESDGPTGLDYYRARYYRPDLQRFISEDPVGFAGGDADLYAYVGNAPIDYIDPSGLRRGRGQTEPCNAEGSEPCTTGERKDPGGGGHGDGPSGQDPLTYSCGTFECLFGNPFDEFEPAAPYLVGGLTAGMACYSGGKTMFEAMSTPAIVGNPFGGSEGMALMVGGSCVVKASYEIHKHHIGGAP